MLRYKITAARAPLRGARQEIIAHANPIEVTRLKGRRLDLGAMPCTIKSQPNAGQHHDRHARDEQPLQHLAQVAITITSIPTTKSSILAGTNL